jgi:hypothetical protein
METQRGEIFGQLMIDRLSLFLFQNKKKELRTISRYFMHSTSVEWIEQLVMLAPNFPQKRSGYEEKFAVEFKYGMTVDLNG